MEAALTWLTVGTYYIYIYMNLYDICTYYLWIYMILWLFIYIYILYTLFFQWFGPWLRLVMSWLQCCYACDEVPGRCMWKSPHHTEMGSSFTQLFEGLRDHWSWGSDSSDKGCTHPSGTIHPLFCRWMFQLLFICCKVMMLRGVWDMYYMILYEYMPKIC